MYVTIGLVYGSSYAMVPAHQAHPDYPSPQQDAEKQLLECMRHFLCAMCHLTYDACGDRKRQMIHNYTESQNKYRENLETLATSVEQDLTKLHTLIINVLPNILRYETMPDSFIQQIDELRVLLNIEGDAAKLIEDVRRDVIYECLPANEHLTFDEFLRSTALLEVTFHWLLIDCCVCKINSSADKSLMSQYDASLQELLLFFESFANDATFKNIIQKIDHRFDDQIQDRISGYILLNKKQKLDKIFKDMIDYREYGHLIRRDNLSQDPDEIPDEKIFYDIPGERQSVDILKKVRDIIKNIQEYAVRMNISNNKELCMVLFGIWYLLYHVDPAELAKPYLTIYGSNLKS